jgi:hypothetical protein
MEAVTLSGSMASCAGQQCSSSSCLLGMQACWTRTHADDAYCMHE